MRIAGRLSAVALLLVPAALVGIAPGARAAAPPCADAAGLTVVSCTVTTRGDTLAQNRQLYSVEFTSPSVVYSGPNVSSANPEEPQPGLTVVLPATYASRPTVRFPVVYVYTGGNVTATAGSDRRQTLTDPVTTSGENADIVNVSAGKDVILVAVESGRTSTFTNWQRPGTGNHSRFEDFDVNEVIPWVDANFRTVATREGRAVAGLSAGGFGSFSYAARHPELFVSAASLSGAIDTTNILEQQIIAGVSAAGTGYQDGDAIFGRYNDSSASALDGNQLTFRERNPVDLVGNYKGVRLRLYAGTGFVTPEPDLRTMAPSFTALAAGRGMDVQYTDESCLQCSHDWQNWRIALGQYLTSAMDTFAHPPAAPSTWSYTSGESSYSAWGWTVRTVNAFPEMTVLARTATGFTITGSGTASVTTAGTYTPGSTHTVTITGVTRTVTANAQGRIVLNDLYVGPRNTQADYTIGAQNFAAATPNPYRTTTVTIG